jgi:hypothetical protein
MLAGVSALTNKRETNVTLRDGGESRKLTARE